MTKMDKRIIKIMPVINDIDVMINDRPYKKAITISEAQKELVKCSGSQFDPDIVNVLLQLGNEEIKKINEIKC